MLLRLERVLELDAYGLDESIGSCVDLLFDRESWEVRHIVADTGPWIFGRKILLPPAAVDSIDLEKERIDLRLHHDDVLGAPLLKSVEPVHRAFAPGQYASPRFGPRYWAGLGAWADAIVPNALPVPTEEGAVDSAPDQDADEAGDERELRSVREVVGYEVAARDGTVGTIVDGVLEARRWEIRYVLVDVGSWLPGRHVILAPGWFTSFEWTKQRAGVDLSRRQIENAPRLRLDATIDPAYARDLHAYYQKPPYRP